MTNQRSARATLAGLIQMTKALQGGSNNSTEDLECSFQSILREAFADIPSDKEAGNQSNDVSADMAFAFLQQSQVHAL